MKTAASERQRYQHERYHPSPDLERYVEHYWVVEWDLRGAAPERTGTLPHPSVHMIFERDDRSRIRGAARKKFSKLLEEKGGIFAVKFTPGGFYPFVGAPVSGFSDKIVRLRDVFGQRGDDLNRAVLAEGTDLSRINLVESFLLACLRNVDEADENVPKVTVQDLVDRYALNKRMLQRLFAKYVGVSPKWTIQRFRLIEAAEELASGESISQSQLALSLGYSDQAHFIRDFKSIVGVSPAAYARAARQS